MTSMARWPKPPISTPHRRLDGTPAHHTQLEVWAENCPENFDSRTALGGAEIARIERRDIEVVEGSFANPVG